MISLRPGGAIGLSGFSLRAMLIISSFALSFLRIKFTILNALDFEIIAISVMKHKEISKNIFEFFM